MARFYFRKNKRFRKNKPKQSRTVDDLSRDIGTFSPGLVLGSKSILPLTLLRLIEQRKNLPQKKINKTQKNRLQRK
tara:strand:- start:1610 stop:1837 length:228 start_codon:yes stop_codon:yes gene_type:complete